MRNFFKSHLRLLSVMGALVAALVGSLSPVASFATGTDTPFNPSDTSQIDGFGTTVALYGGAVIAVVLIGAGVMLAIKYLRKATSKA